MLDVELTLCTSSIDSYIALIKKYGPPIVVVQDQTIPQRQYGQGEAYVSSFDTVINGRPTLCSFQIQKSAQYYCSSKSEVLQWLTRLGVLEADQAVLRKTSMKQLKSATHEQISDDEEKVTVHTKNELGVYQFTARNTNIKVSFDLAALGSGQIRACITLDYGKEITNFTQQIKTAMPEGGIVVEDAKHDPPDSPA